MVQKTILSKYIKVFQKLRINKTKVRGESPHKPILLLAIIDGIEQHFIQSRMIEITPELVAAFKFRWIELVVDIRHRERFALPFFHLKSSKFWTLVPKKGYEKILNQSTIRSFAYLKEGIQCALLEEELYILLLDKKGREVLKYTLLKRYFPNHQQLKSGNQLFIDFENQVLEEDSVKYGLAVDMEDEEQNFVRGGFFKKLVPKIYNNQCAISALNITVTANVSMIDACHIIPFSINQNDKISNGFALCPNLHRAFDRGLISIDENYHVITSSAFIENGYSPYNIKMFEGKKIWLPENRKYYPSQENFEWHRKNRFLK